LAQGLAARIHGGVVGLVGIGLAVALACNFKLVQVAVLPAHDGLDGALQWRQRDGFSHYQTAPDGGLGIAQLNMQLVAVGGFRHGVSSRCQSQICSACSYFMSGCSAVACSAWRTRVSTGSACAGV